ncbi:DEAD/DEAH box helicase family protein [Acinetobacter lwoffii]|uniref:DEAD/DEAH box helicase n=1 Tax=Acinetobacter lwoffii TaxID=28090 RepID=UPI001FB3329A|nr:DEAD/DEAH box helicase family protein [Acinetobacter lwoffii]MCJ0929369.1 DEAD/DEAH box helicase family protein [Acinetobacter lwoffii]
MIEEIDTQIQDNLRECQIKSIEVIAKYLRSKSEGSCLISLPTGAGKSGVICTVSHNCKYKKILVVTHRRAVCDQLYRQLKGKFFEKILPPEFDHKSFIKKDIFNNINDISKDGVYCTTFQKITSLSESELLLLKNSFALILIDEGHAEPSPKWGATIRELVAKKIIITATPYRNDLFSFDIDVKHSYIYTYKKATEDNVIVQPCFDIINMNQLTQKIRELKEEQPDSICIVKCKNFSDIQDYFNEFTSTFRTVAIHDQYETNPLDHKYNYVPQNLAELGYEVLIHQRKLDEGIDIPEAKILILTYPVGSGKELVQTIGRIVRIYKNYKPTVLEVGAEKNFNLWKNYLEFDDYLTNEKSAARFLNTLNTANLIDKYLDAFPDRSYFESNYRKKFNFKEFNPIESLEIPLASVCFYNKLEDFNLYDCLDKLHWDFTREGALSKYDSELGVITAVCFNNSKFLKDSLFFEPSLEILIVKELDDIVAIFDSSGRKFNDRDELKIGRAINVDQLFTVVSSTKKTITKQANTRALQYSLSRAEGIALKAENLELINQDQSNSAYAITTTVVSNIDDNDKIVSSYYLGVASGRISDQKNSKFTYAEYMQWLEDINNHLQSNKKPASNFLNSFAQVVDYIPTDDPVACILDFTDSKFYDLEIDFDGFRQSIENNFIYKKYNNGIYFFKLFYQKDDILIKELRNFIKFSFNEKLELITECNSGINFFINKELAELEEVFNENTVKLLYKDGTVYLNKYFYKQVLPTQSGKINQNIIKNIIPLECLKHPQLSEKDEDNLTHNKFSPNSIFHLIDQVSNIHNPNVLYSDLGQFYQYIPNVDLVLCTDMGTEPADFILSSKEKVVFVHIKCGDSSKRPKSSAGALCEVGGQALKNLHHLVNTSPLKYGNITNIQGDWPSPTGNDQGIKLNRIRLFNKTFNIDHMLNEVVFKKLCHFLKLLKTGMMHYGNYI